MQTPLKTSIALTVERNFSMPNLDDLLFDLEMFDTPRGACYLCGADLYTLDEVDADMCESCEEDEYLIDESVEG